MTALKDQEKGTNSKRVQSLRGSPTPAPVQGCERQGYCSPTPRRRHAWGHRLSQSSHCSVRLRRRPFYRGQNRGPRTRRHTTRILVNELSHAAPPFPPGRMVEQTFGGLSSETHAPPGFTLARLRQCPQGWWRPSPTPQPTPWEVWGWEESRSGQRTRGPSSCFHAFARTSVGARALALTRCAPCPSRFPCQAISPSSPSLNNSERRCPQPTLQEEEHPAPQELTGWVGGRDT